MSRGPDRRRFLASLPALVAVPGLPASSWPSPAGPTQVAPDQALEVATTIAFTEGPTADRDGNVYFTDIINQRIMKLGADGILSTCREKSNVAVDADDDPQWDLDRRLQGPVQDPQRRLLPAPDDRGRLQPIPAGLPGRPALDCGQRRPADVPASLRQEYNDERPHEALDQETPASRYRPSTRELPRRLAPLEYPGHFEVRRVSRNSGIRWKTHWVCVTHTLAGEYVGLEEVDDGLWDVYFGPITLGRMDERILRIEDHKGRTVRKQVSPMSPD